MKIAFLNIYQGKVERGAETFVSELSKKLTINHEVKIFSSYQNMKKRWSFLWRFYIDPYGFQTFCSTLKFLPLIWREKFDVVIPLNGGWQPALVRLTTWLYGGKMVISGQSGIGWDDRNNLWCFPDTFVALSSYAKSWAGRANPFVKSVYIPNGVNLNKFSSKGKIYKTNLQKPIMLCNAALIHSKRIDLVIKAVAGVNASLLLVGDGELKKEIFDLGKKLLGKRFNLIKIPYEKVDNVYRACDLFTIASMSYYSFEIVLVEAMATGLAVVANNDAIREEIVGEAGILINPENTEEYAKALDTALNKHWGVRPRKQAGKFNWDNVALSYEKLFKVLTSK